MTNEMASSDEFDARLIKLAERLSAPALLAALRAASDEAKSIADDRVTHAVPDLESREREIGVRVARLTTKLRLIEDDIARKRDELVDLDQELVILKSTMKRAFELSDAA